MSDFARRRTIMVDTQVRPSDVTRFPIIEAMLSVPREEFVPRDKREAAYVENNIPLADGRVMLEPRSVAKMLEALDVKPSDLVLVIGAGLGYSSALIARLCEAVVAVEDVPDLARDAEAALAEAGVDNVAVVEEALADGAGKHGPYDAIFIEGAVERLPGNFAELMNEGGRIVALFAEGTLGVAKLGVKADGAISWRPIFNAGAPVLPGFEAERSFAL